MCESESHKCDNRKECDFRKYSSSITQSRWFEAFNMLTVVLDSIFIVHVIDPSRANFPVFFYVADGFFLSVYLLECVLKVCADPRGYWRSASNVLSAVIVLVSWICWFVNVLSQVVSPKTVIVLRVLLIIRLLKMLPDTYTRAYQAFIAAFLRAMKTAVYLIGLMFVVMMIYAVAGFLFFGDPDTGDPDNWGDIGSALFTLFSLATLDDWTDIQQRLDDLSMEFSCIFTITFILICSFGFLNMIIGVVVTEMANAAEQIQKDIQCERKESVDKKKEIIVQQQKKKIERLLQRQTDDDRRLYFIKEYLHKVEEQDNTTKECLQLFTDMMQILKEELEDRQTDQTQKENSQQN
ncbi:cation channel sperm-associated protein 3-like isoform X1 [Xyrauchen texanus]|uniref:cation channel sperm-associated protein 3-like isoform X1 n=1 Tax=Xyrauchen texanus TaxID=154827 RepID=UPI0022424C4E|nr:cation channel sperm-associated protein 3-like isoform X1 [Xyrauchen texanus]